MHETRLGACTEEELVAGELRENDARVVSGAEARGRELLGRLRPGSRRFALDTNAHGSRRAMVPIGLYERLMPMDLMPTHLLRALTVGEVEWAEELGALELDEEDLAWATALMVVGPELAWEMAAAHGLEVLLLIEGEGGRIETRVTPGFAAADRREVAEMMVLLLTIACIAAAMTAMALAQCWPASDSAARAEAWTNETRACDRDGVVRSSTCPPRRRAVPADSPPLATIRRRQRG